MCLRPSPGPPSSPVAPFPRARLSGVRDLSRGVADLRPRLFRGPPTARSRLSTWARVPSRTPTPPRVRWHGRARGAEDSWLSPRTYTWLQEAGGGTAALL